VTIDASALLAVTLAEPDGMRFALAIAAAERPRVPSATWFEATMRVDVMGDATVASRFDALIQEGDIEIIPVIFDHVREARRARRLYGTPHKAQLNFGDCLVYGVARHEREPLLFEGNDFSQTDIETASKD